MRELINTLINGMEWIDEKPGEFIVLGLMVTILLCATIAGLKDVRRA